MTGTYLNIINNYNLNSFTLSNNNINNNLSTKLDLDSNEVSNKNLEENYYVDFLEKNNIEKLSKKIQETQLYKLDSAKVIAEKIILPNSQQFNILT
ncbi:MAG: hypothetical protein GX287_07080 [Fusobacteria bacterium]|nr:hypothetical protein [Fusobacteriota bacterium]